MALAELIEAAHTNDDIPMWDEGQATFVTTHIETHSMSVEVIEKLYGDVAKVEAGGLLSSLSYWKNHNAAVDPLVTLPDHKAMPAAQIRDRVALTTTLDAIGVMQVAKARIEKYGWTRGATYSPHGICLGSALGVWADDTAKLPGRQEAVGRVAAVLRSHGVTADTDGAERVIITWNDRYARGKDDAFQILDRTIEIALRDLADAV